VEVVEVGLIALMVAVALATTVLVEASRIWAELLRSTAFTKIDQVYDQQESPGRRRPSRCGCMHSSDSPTKPVVVAGATAATLASARA